MKGIFNPKIIVFYIAIIFGVLLSLPSLFTLPGPKITLGLDLQGGLSMLLGVKTQEAIASKFRSLGSSLNFFAKDEQILIDNLIIKEQSISFELLDEDEKEKIHSFILSNGNFIISVEDKQYNISMSEEEEILTKNYALGQAIDTIRNRLDQFGLRETTVARQGEDSILVEIPGIKTQEEEQRAKELIARAAHLQMMAVDEDYAARSHNMNEDEIQKIGDILLPFVYNPQNKLLLKEIPILDGSMLTDARVAYGQDNKPVINFTLNAQGAKVFADFSEHNIGKRMAIVLDNKIYSAPVIKERIGGGSGQISGNFTVNEASDIAIALRSGALLAPIELLEQRSVGPSLGADSILASVIALIIGFVLTTVFMCVYYGLAGIIANIAMVVNLLLIIAVMAIFQATLTLPGMAGVVLTIGMAIDANIIINERIRECLRESKGIIAAIELGYENAQRAIFDSNLTALITSVLLYIFGTGAIKGFAITISIGIIASVITAIIGTHGVYRWLSPYIAKSKNISLWFGYKHNTFNTKGTS